MNVGDLYEKLSYGPMSNLYCSVEGSGEIDENRKPALISHANDALLRLYSEFILLEKDLVIQTVMGITNYHLLPRFAVNNPAYEKHKYIIDLPEEKFLGDIIKIHAVFDSSGYRLPLNDETSAFSVFSPTGDILQIPRAADRLAYGVQYQARHPKLDWENDDQSIDLPLVLQEALVAYIGFKTYSNIRSDTSIANAQEQLALYNGVIQQVKDNDLVSSSITQTNTRFEKRGWI